MLARKVVKVAKAWGWYYTPRKVFGIYNNYLFILGRAGRCYSLKTPIAGMSDKEKTALVQLLLDSAIQEELGYRYFNISSDYLQLRFRIPLFRASDFSFYDVMEFLSDYLTEKGYPSSDSCSLCGDVHNKEFFAAGDDGLALCPLCVPRWEEQKGHEKEAFLREKKGYAAGLGGGLAWGAAALLPWALLAEWSPWGAAVAALAFSFLVLLGFRRRTCSEGVWAAPLIVLESGTLLAAVRWIALFLKSLLRPLLRDGSWELPEPLFNVSEWIGPSLILSLLFLLPAGAAAFYFYLRRLRQFRLRRPKQFLSKEER